MRNHQVGVYSERTHFQDARQVKPPHIFVVEAKYCNRATNNSQA